MNTNRNIIFIFIGVILITLAVYGYQAAQKTKETTAQTNLPFDQYPSYAPQDSVTGKPVTSTAERMLTQSNNNTVVRIKQGEKFTLKLGEMNWTIKVSDQGIIAPIKNTTKGVQGEYQGKNPGTSIITAEGRPICKEGGMCAQYIVSFKVTIIVE
jgi:hypothetical protein